MGLDNGIILKTESIVPSRFEKESYASDKGMYEICYWRKCWGIRGAILKVLDPEGLHKDDYRFTIEAEDIPAIIRAIKPFFNASYWEEHGESIWEFDEIFETLLNQLVNLEYLKDYLMVNPDASVYFYDSY